MSSDGGRSPCNFIGVVLGPSQRSSTLLFGRVCRSLHGGSSELGGRRRVEARHMGERRIGDASVDGGSGHGRSNPSIVDDQVGEKARPIELI